jgi:hypothetical protein
VSLERELRALGASVEWPTTPDVSTLVRARIAEQPRRASRWRRHRLAIAVAVVLAAVAATLAVPSARSAILRALGLGSVKVVRVDELPPAAPREDLSLLGPVTTRAYAEELFAAPLLRFDPDILGEPDEIRALDRPSRVSYVWRNDNGEIELLVSQLHGVFGGANYVKAAGPGTDVEDFLVDGRRALWLSGDVHGFGLVDPTGGGFNDFEELRLSGNALLVQDGRTTIRIEGDFTRKQALRFYHALR